MIRPAFPPVLGHTGRTFLAAGLLVAVHLAPGPAAAERKWESVDRRESRVLSTLSNQDGYVLRYARGQSEDYATTVHLAVRSGKARAWPKMRLQYLDVSPGYFLRSSFDVEGYLERSTTWTEAGATVGDAVTVKAALGSFSGNRFAFATVQCFAAVTGWGQSSTMTTSEGTQRLLVEYCSEPGDTLTQRQIEGVLGSVRIRE